MPVFCTDMNFPFDRYLDPFHAKIARNLCTALNCSNAQFYRELIKFQWDNEELLDPVHIGYAAARNAWRAGRVEFDNLSEKAQDFISRKKLWDFMEEIPLDEDPRMVCKELTMELVEKIRDKQ